MDDENKLILFQIPEHLSLHEMDEGHIGKLKVYKSGRVELVLNDEKYFDASLSVSGEFLQVIYSTKIYFLFFFLSPTFKLSFCRFKLYRLLALKSINNLKET